MNQIVKGYKAFEKGLRCRGYQYTIGEEHSHDGDIELCAKGFHFCQNPMDLLSFYPLVDEKGEVTEFAEVESIGDVKSDEQKSVTNKLRIVAKLDLSAFIKASLGFMWEKCTGGKEIDKLVKSTKKGVLKKNVSEKEEARLAASGWNSQLAASGWNSQLAASGADSQLAASGWNSQLAASGDRSRLAASGDRSRLAASGWNSRLAASGDRSRLAASGWNSQLAMEAGDSIAAAVGPNSQIKGKNGDWMILAEYDNDGKVIGVVSGKIDGKKLKEDVWYTVQKGKFIAI